GAGPFGLVHFAAHAVTDEVNPDRSAIYLSPGNSQEDGVLQVREIAEMDLGGRIVVLSTCESASGGILRGEGVMGLARAFFQAGAHTVVASLWKLRDDDGAALFDRFYLHLGQGKSVAAALQAAQRDRMGDGAPAEAWAGVVVLGDGDRVPVPGGRRPSLVPWALVLGLLAAALLAYGARRARQRRMTIA
ncbi:MAG TPA: CHAT domain-containing protein, partial [Thermoanaerobaculia bacterium]|nr:CHAT domain-containing protein [Thermoanaerobaculia bacterium]